MMAVDQDEAEVAGAGVGAGPSRMQETSPRIGMLFYLPHCTYRKYYLQVAD